MQLVLVLFMPRPGARQSPCTQMQLAGNAYSVGMHAEAAWYTCLSCNICTALHSRHSIMQDDTALYSNAQHNTAMYNNHRSVQYVQHAQNATAYMHAEAAWAQCTQLQHVHTGRSVMCLCCTYRVRAAGKCSMQDGILSWHAQGDQGDET